jgi:hypothetical protein
MKRFPPLPGHHWEIFIAASRSDVNHFAHPNGRKELAQRKGS